MADATPENSPTPWRRPPRRGNCPPTCESQLVETADGSQSLDRLRQSLRLEDAAHLAARDVMADIVQTSERGPQARRRAPRPSRSRAPGGRGSRPGQRSAPCFGPPSCPASRPRGPRPALGPCRNRAARACVCPCCSRPPSPNHECRGSEPDYRTFSCRVSHRESRGEEGGVGNTGRPPGWPGRRGLAAAFARAAAAFFGS